MKANELRVGNNLLSVSGKRIVEVDWLVIKHIQDGNIQSAYDFSPVYKPIKITGELLLNLGFAKQTFREIQSKAVNEYHFKDHNLLFVLFELVSRHSIYRLEVRDAEQRVFKLVLGDIDSLHDLQNRVYNFNKTIIKIDERKSEVYKSIKNQLDSKEMKQEYNGI